MVKKALRSRALHVERAGKNLGNKVRQVHAKIECEQITRSILSAMVFALWLSVQPPHQKSSVGHTVCSWEWTKEASRPTCSTTGATPWACRRAKICPTNNE